MTNWTTDTFRRALETGEFTLFYQPQVSSDGKHLMGVEALVRRVTADGVVSPPSSFIAELEALGVVAELTRNLFPHVCTAVNRWPALTVAVNISPQEFRRPELVQFLIDTADAAAAEKHRIEIEITEGLFFDDPERAEVMLGELREAGFSIALDDFGTGYSSLAYLLRFPVTKIKIDRSFVKDVPHSIKAASIIHALIALARAIGLKVVAEGIETEDQRAFLRSAGCHVLQGFLFSPAVSASALAALLERSAPPSSAGSSIA